MWSYSRHNYDPEIDGPGDPPTKKAANRKALAGRMVGFLVFAVIIGPMTCCLLPIAWDARGRGPVGRPIPEGAPDESRRIHHPAGFSIIAPPDWDARTDGPLFLAPRQPGRPARRHKALISVMDIGHSQPSQLVEDLRVVEYLGQTAYEKMSVVRKDTFDDPAWSEYILFVRHGGSWYMVTYGIAEERTELPDVVRRYLDTLRWDDGQPAAPAPPAKKPGRENGMARR